MADSPVVRKDFEVVAALLKQEISQKSGMAGKAPKRVDWEVKKFRGAT